MTDIIIEMYFAQCGRKLKKKKGWQIPMKKLYNNIIIWFTNMVFTKQVNNNIII